MQEKRLLSKIPQKQHMIPADVLPSYSEALFKFQIRNNFLGYIRQTTIKQCNPLLLKTCQNHITLPIINNTRPNPSRLEGIFRNQICVISHATILSYNLSVLQLFWECCQGQFTIFEYNAMYV